VNFNASSATSSRSACPARRHGFSIIEVIVVIGLMSFIVFGLVLMFSQTQRAYKLGTTQVDVMESGRATIDLIGRELAVIAPAQLSKVVNFYAELPFDPPLRQALPGISTAQRVNVIQDLYFLTEENQTWKGVGYLIANRAAGVGTLYRYEMSTRSPVSPQDMFVNFYSNYSDGGGTNKVIISLNQPLDNELKLNINRIMDGVVHFRVSAYNPEGFWITNQFLYGAQSNLSMSASSLIPGEVGYLSMYSNLVPASVELEIGVLEDAALAKAKAIPNLNRRYDYLTNQASRVHLFRVRVPVRNVDPNAYP